MNVATSTRGGLARPLLVVIATAGLLLAFLASVGSASATADNYTPGDSGHPTSGESSNLMGAAASFTFETNATLTCDAQDSAEAFSFHIDYSVTGTVPGGATLVVYLSPNQGAINGNAGGDAAGYIAAVESNFITVDIGNLSGSGTLDVGLTITEPFTLSTGGVLGVIAREADESIVSNSKTNSLNCTEAPGHTPAPSPSQSTAPSASEAMTASPTESVAPSASASASATPSETVAPTPEGSVQGATGTPAPTSTPEGGVLGATGSPAPAGGVESSDGAVGGPISSGLLAALAALLLVISLGWFAVLNLREVRRRR